MDDSTHYTKLAAAYARGRLGLPGKDDVAVLEAAQQAQLRLHRYKRNAELARVRKVLGVLRGLAPESLLDVGAGRGTFLWPLLDAFEALPVVAIDADSERAEQLECVRAGGIERLSAHCVDVCDTPFDDDQFDVTTVLEVLEHLHTPASAVRELVRVTRRFIVASVPSRPDDNPEHLRLFTRTTLEQLLREGGCRRVRVDEVLNHYIVVGNL